MLFLFAKQGGGCIMGDIPDEFLKEKILSRVYHCSTLTPSLDGSFLKAFQIPIVNHYNLNRLAVGVCCMGH